MQLCQRYINRSPKYTSFFRSFLFQPHNFQCCDLLSFPFSRRVIILRLFEINQRSSISYRNSFFSTRYSAHVRLNRAVATDRIAAQVERGFFERRSAGNRSNPSIQLSPNRDSQTYGRLGRAPSISNYFSFASRLLSRFWSKLFSSPPSTKNRAPRTISLETRRTGFPTRGRERKERKGVTCSVPGGGDPTRCPLASSLAG